MRVTLIALLFDFLFCWANLNAEQELKEPNVGFWFPSSIANSPQSKAAINEKDLWEEDFANWLMNPKPYGGKDTLLQIKEARTNQTEELNLGYDSYISDLSPIAELTHLTALSLTNNSKFNSPIITIHGTIRDEVHEVQNAVRDLSPLTKLVNLKLLSLNDHNISDISPLANLTNLEYLSLGKGMFTSLGMPSFFKKNIIDKETTITDLTPLSALTTLLELNLAHNNITNISALANLTSLVELNLAQNNITNISALANLTNLEYLSLRANPISDISPLNSMVSLKVLELNDCNLIDLSPLFELKGLNYISLTGNKFTESEIETLKSYLPETNITYFEDTKFEDTKKFAGHIDSVGKIENGYPMIRIRPQNANDITVSSTFRLSYLGNKWYKHEQFGTFYDANGSDWYYHLDHGWIYVDEWDDNGTWIYVPLGDEIGNDDTESSIMSESIALGWMWSKAEYYPQLYNNELQDWMYFNKDRNESKYYCYSLKRYLTKDFITKFSVSENDWKSLEPLFFWDEYQDYDYSPLYDSELTSAGTWNVTIPKEELELDDNWSSTIKSILEVANEAEKRGIIDIQDAGEFYKFKFGTASAAVTAGHILESIESDILLKEKESFHEKNYNNSLLDLLINYGKLSDQLDGLLSGGLDLNPTGSLISSNDNNLTSFLAYLGTLTGATGLSDVHNNDFLNVDVPVKNIKLDSANIIIGKQGEDTSVDVSSNLITAANHDDRKILLVGAAKDLTIAGNTTFTNTYNVEDHSLVLGASDDFKAFNSRITHTGSNLALSSADHFFLADSNVSTGGNLAVGSLHDVQILGAIISISSFSSDPSNLYIYGNELVNISDSKIVGFIDDIYLEGRTIDLKSVNFPANSEVMLRSSGGELNFLTNQLGYANLSKVTHDSIDNGRILTSQDFIGSTGNYDSVARKPNGSPYIRIRSL